MSSVATIRRVAIVSCALATSLALADVGDEYERFVDAAIPLSFEIARERAFVQEFAVFTDRLSEVSEIMARASAAAEALKRCAERLSRKTSAGVCPKSATPEELKSLLERRFWVSQCTALRQDLIRYSILVAHKLSESRTACTADLSFEVYRAEQLGLNFRRVPLIETFDGIYLAYGDNYLAAAAAGASGYHSVQNMLQREKIRSAHNRLYKEMVSTSHYRKLAKESCSRILANSAATFKQLEVLASAYSRIPLSLDETVLSLLASRLDGCIADFDRTSVERLRQEAIASASPRQNEEDRLRRYLEGKAKVMSALRKLNSIPCGEDTGAVNLVRAATSEWKLISDDGRVQFLSSEIDASLRSRRYHCARSNNQ